MSRGNLERALAPLPDPNSISESNWRDLVVQDREHSEICRAYPEYLQLELSQACNFHCSHCATHGTSEIHRHYNSLESPYLLDPVLERLANELFPFVRRVDLIGVGEPFVAPRPLLDRLIRHLENTGTYLEATTNGSLLTDELIDRIVPVLGQLTFSMDAATSETFERVRHSNRFERVLNSIRRLHQIREGAVSGRRYSLLLIFTMMRKNVHELPDFIRLASDLGADAVYARHVFIHHPELRSEGLFDDPSVVNPVLEKAAAVAEELGVSVFLPGLIESEAPTSSSDSKRPPESANDGAPDPSEPLFVPCSFLWRTTFVFADGRITPCGGLAAPKIGNLLDTPFADIWNGEAMREMRRRLDTRNPHPACAHCWYREIAYFESSAINDDFFQRGNPALQAKSYDEMAFLSPFLEKKE